MQAGYLPVHACLVCYLHAVNELAHSHVLRKSDTGKYYIEMTTAVYGEFTDAPFNMRQNSKIVLQLLFLKYIA